MPFRQTEPAAAAGPVAPLAPLVPLIPFVPLMPLPSLPPPQALSERTTDTNMAGRNLWW